MLRQILLATTLLTSFNVVGQDYRISDIPDSLKKDANAVFLIDEASHTIISEDKAIYKCRQVLAILNSKGKSFAEKVVGYDKDSKIIRFKGKVYDEFGKKLRETGKSDIYDRSSVSGFSIYEDNRLQYLDLQRNDYPYIVEISYEKEYSQTFSISDWYVNSHSNVSVLKSEFSVSAPLDLFPNIKIENTDKEFESFIENDIMVSSIEFNNLKAKNREPLGPYLFEITPIIRVSPSKFKYADYSGDFSNWESFGMWMNSLNEGRNDLSEEAKADIKLITDNYESEEEKIKAVYEYVQDRTRYVSIQLGIGGFQTFPASSVEALGYGDCKALSNYTHSLLSVIGIDSYYTLVYAGDNKLALDPNFADNRFNHAILCVPVENDTVWLECTSQTNPFGYQGSFTGNREALIITPNGGKIVKTNIYSKQDNQQVTNAEVWINSSGQASASIKVTFTGLQHENNYLNRRIDDGEEKLKKWIYENTDIPSFEITAFNFNYIKSKIPVIEETLEINVSSLASMSGKRMFLVPNLMNKTTYVPKNISNRKTDVILDMAYQNIDTVTYKIPEAYHLEYLPEKTTIESQFGKYEANYEYMDGELIYVRRMEREKGNFPKESYNEFRDFYKSISKADKTKVVFVDKT